MAVVLPVHVTTEEASGTGSGTAEERAAIGIPPAEDEAVENVDLTTSLPIKTAELTSAAKKESATLLTKKDSTSPIKKGSNSPAKRDFVSPMEVTVTLNTDADEHNDQKNLEVPVVRKSPPSYGPNNSARRANRRKGGSPGPSPNRPSSPPLLTPDSRSPASSRPASPFSPASTAARRHSHEELTVPAARATSQRRPSAPVVSAPSPTPQFTHPQLVNHPLRNSRSMKDTREGARSESHDECIPRARSQSQKRVKNPADPFDLARFTEAQKENGTFERAIGEIKAGRKSSCWMWFVIPSPPHMKNKVEHGSSMNRKYAIRSDEEGKAFLNFESDGVDLRDNYFNIINEVLQHVKAGKAARSVIGGFDEPKLASSIVLFERLSRDEDKEMNEMLTEIAGFMNLQFAPDKSQ